MSEQPEEKILSLEDDSFSAICVPTNLFDYTLDNIISLNYINGAKNRFKDEIFGSIEIQIMPEIEITMTEIQDAYRKTNQANFYSTLGTYGHSIIQHKYNLDYKSMKNIRSDKFAKGKLKDLAKVYRWKSHLFEKVEGGRGRVAFYADTDDVIATIHQYKKYFGMSASDIVQVCLCEVILRWEPLHEDNKGFFVDTLAEFDKRVKGIMGEVDGI